MKNAKKILLNRLILTAKGGIMALGLSVILCIPTMTMSVYAIGHDHYYFGIAYLAEKEARSDENTAESKNNTVVATVKVSANEKQEGSSYNHERNISLKREMRTDRER